MLLLLFLASVVASGLNCTTLHRNDLLDCFLTIIDKNGDGQLNATEIDIFVIPLALPVRPVIMYECDINHDGVLDMSDWTAPNACAQDRPTITRVCHYCAISGWSNNKKKKTVK